MFDILLFLLKKSKSNKRIIFSLCFFLFLLRFDFLKEPNLPFGKWGNWTFVQGCRIVPT